MTCHLAYGVLVFERGEVFDVCRMLWNFDVATTSVRRKGPCEMSMRVSLR